MGWGRTLFLGDIGNRLDIADTERDIAYLKRQSGDAFLRDVSQDQIIRRLVQENAELKLYLASVVRLLVRKGNISKDELKAMVAAIDAEDGETDGQFQGTIG